MDKIDRKGLGIVLISSSIIISILMIYRFSMVILNNYYSIFNDTSGISITLMVIFTLNLISKLGFYFLNTKDK